MIVDPNDRERRVERELYELQIHREAKRILEAQERGPVVEPEFLTLRERLKRPRAETRWRIDRWQPLGSRVMLAAQFKAGKTTLVGNYIRSLADGADFLGQDSVSATATTGTIVLLDFEMSEAQLEDWLKDQRIKRDDKVLAIAMRGRAGAFNILDPDVRSRWAKQLKVNGAEVAILDCLRPVLDALGLDEHKDGGRFLVAFDALLREAEVLDALVVHHMGHMNERARGDSRFRDWPDAEWRLVRQDEQPHSPRFLSAYGRDVDVSESQLAFDPQTRGLTLVGGSRQDAKATAALDAIVEVLTGTEGLSGRAIKKALADSEHSKHAIEDALKNWASSGRLNKVNGPRGAHIYRSVPVSQTVPRVSQVHRRESLSKCPTALIERDTQDTPTVTEKVIQMPVSRRDSHREVVDGGLL
jgi:hypothetical protein